MYRQSPRIPEDDEISFISMQELAPTPIEDDDYLNLSLPHMQPVERKSSDLSASNQSISSHNSASPRSLAFWRQSPPSTPLGEVTM